ncbi:hypothetical protein QFC22_005185 [Naganishia vaughanmartiniae]|uniref:Uncharacterized protein n=1 Tax=Naganishia vaughanmartiniae TaxID=1424756 RepID=A0ACC2WVF7_9TREE|nr:hypothetical protein QFC22_005185 [Naganishia vaughanmartiniae]
MTQDCNPDSIKSLKQQIETYHSQLADDAESAVFVCLPSKVIELSRLVESFNRDDSPFSASHPSFDCDTTILTLPPTTPTEGFRPTYGRTSTQTPAEVTNSIATAQTSSTLSPAFSSTDASHDAGALSGEHEDDKPIRTGLTTNPIFETIGKVMDQQGADVLRFCMQIRRWMATVTPQVEEGNNTGVEIQELAISYLNSLQNMGSDCSNYLVTTRQPRGGMVRMYLRSPGIEDRMLALYESDRRELFSARQLLNLLQSKCMETMNVFQKNWNKICCAALIYIWVILLGPALKSSAALGPDFRNAYLRSAAYLSFIWALYPIAWGLADGANVISPDAEMIFYGILDLLAKPVFTLWHVYQISRLDYTKMQLQSGKFSEGAAMIRENELHSVNNSALKNARADATATGRFSEATAREV